MCFGFDKPLYVLPFDHRATFRSKMSGWKGTLTPAQSEEITAAKRVIYDPIEAALATAVPQHKAGFCWTNTSVGTCCRMPLGTAPPSRGPSKKVARRSSTSNTVGSSPATSRRSNQLSPRYRCTIARRASALNQTPGQPSEATVRLSTR
jgi:hypothetical protein